MMQEDYKAKGWLGMLLGVRLYYQFCGVVLESDAMFGGKGGGTVPRAWGARESARRTNVNGNVDLFILWHLLCVLLTAKPPLMSSASPPS